MGVQLNPPSGGGTFYNAMGTPIATFTTSDGGETLQVTSLVYPNQPVMTFIWIENSLLGGGTYYNNTFLTATININCMPASQPIDDGLRWNYWAYYRPEGDGSWPSSASDQGPVY